MGSEPQPGTVVVRSPANKPSHPGCQSPAVSTANCRTVHILRNREGKFGFRFTTVLDKDGTPVTLVKTVKSDCQIVNGFLQPLDQILMINDVSIASLMENDVYKELQKVKSDCVRLVVASRPSAKLGQLMSTGPARPPLAHGPHCSTELTGCSTMPSRQHSHTYGSMADSQHSSLSGCQQPLINLPQVPDHVAYFPLAQDPLINDPPLSDYAHSLPVATDDIALRVEPTHSLPLASSVPRHMPPLGLSSCGHPRSMSGGSGGPWNLNSSSALNGASESSSRSGASSSFLDMLPCRNPCCEVEGCSWHGLIVRCPHFVIWDPTPLTVLLEKGRASSFQFSYKVKVHDRKGDVFSVVTQVKPGGPADGSLQVGDNILSCNGTPLESANKAYHYDFEKFNSLKLVIQRPTAISAKAGHARDQSSLSRSPATPTSPFPTGSPVSSTSPFPSPSCTCPPQVRPAFCHQHSGGEEPLLRRMVAKKRASNNDSAFDSLPSSPLTPESSSLTTPLLLASSGGPPSSPTVVSPLTSSPVFVSADHCCYLLKGRVVICGSKAADLAHSLLSGVPGLDSSSSCPVSFHKLCLCHHGDDSVQFHEWQSNSASLLRGYVAPGTPQPSSCQVHSEASPVPVLNTEIYVISEENFFQQACHRLWTSSCVYLVTFDAQRLVNSAAVELAQLARFLHAIRTNAGKEAVIKMYGVLPKDGSAGDSMVGEDEVRTLFYTPVGHQLEVYSVPIPEVISLQESPSPAKSQLRQVNKVLLEAMVALATGIKVSPAALVLHDFLSGEASLFGVHHRSALISALQGRKLRLSEMACSQAVNDLIRCGELVPLPAQNGLGSGGLGMEGEEELIWGPGFLHHLSLLLLEPQSQSPQASASLELSFRLASTATASHPDLLSLLEAVTPHTKQAVAILQRAGVIFPLSKELNTAPCSLKYLVPYFQVEGMGGPELGSGVRQELELHLVARPRLSWQLFHQLCSTLAMHPGCSGLRLPSLGVCVLSLPGLEISLHLQLTVNRIHFTISRTATPPMKESRVLALLRDLLAQMLPSKLTFDLGPACPLPCSRPPDLHILDLQRTPVYCGQTRVDTHPSIKIWMMNDVSRATSQEDVMSQSIMKLKFSVLTALSRRLSIEHHSMPDWRTLADHIGMTTEDVELISSLGQGLPAEHLLKEWGRTEHGTIGRLHAALTEMGRPDVLLILQNYIDEQMRL